MIRRAMVSVERDDEVGGEHVDDAREASVERVDAAGVARPRVEHELRRAAAAVAAIGEPRLAAENGRGVAHLRLAHRGQIGLAPLGAVARPLLAARGHEKADRRAALAQAAEKWGDEELVVGMRADPEDALRV